MCELDAIFGVLANERRRLTLYYLQKHRTVTLPDLAELVAEHEQGVDVSEISGKEVKTVYAALYHTHVPALEETDLAHYEQDDDRISRTEHASTALEDAAAELTDLQNV